MDCYSTRLDQAMALAAQAFRRKRRKGTDIPYLSHLLQVSVTVMEHGGDENQAIAAVLHDYLEDIDGASADELRAAFGDDVTELVIALSDTTVAVHKPPWQERKERYLEHLRLAPERVKLVSAADKLHNCRSIERDLRHTGDAVWSRFTASRGQTLWYYRSVVASLGHGWKHRLHGELVEAVVDLHREAGEYWDQRWS